MRALVIDDSKAMRMIMGRMLKEMNFEVYEAPDGQAALSYLQSEGGVDLALVDWNMPIMNGLEFVQAVRADVQFKDLRLMMVTTESEFGQMEKALAAGANEYVMKPFTKDVIQCKLGLMGIA